MPWMRWRTSLGKTSRSYSRFPENGIGSGGKVPITETLRGEGKVFKGQEFIADVHYELQIRSHYNTTRTMEGEGRYLAGKTVQLRIRPSTAVTGQFGVE